MKINDAKKVIFKSTVTPVSGAIDQPDFSTICESLDVLELVKIGGVDNVSVYVCRKGGVHMSIVLNKKTTISCSIFNDKKKNTFSLWRDSKRIAKDMNIFNLVKSAKSKEIIISGV